MERRSMLIGRILSIGDRSMKKLALVFLLLQASLLTAVSAGPNPANFPVLVHVVFTRAVWADGYQQIEAVIDGQRVELTGFSLGMLALGDYHAHVSDKVHGPKNPNDYDIYKGYDFLMSDGKVRTYQVTAMGNSAFPAPPPAPRKTSDTPVPVPVPAPDMPQPTPMPPTP
jgi:hypothetical protein